MDGRYVYRQVQCNESTVVIVIMIMIESFYMYDHVYFVQKNLSDNY